MKFRVGPKLNDRCLYKRKEREAGDTVRHRVKGSEFGQGTPGAPVARRGRKDPPLEPLEGVGPWDTLILDFRTRNVWIIFCCSEPRSLWYFAVAAPEMNTCKHFQQLIWTWRQASTESSDQTNRHVFGHRRRGEELPEG